MKNLEETTFYSMIWCINASPIGKKTTEKAATYTLCGGDVHVAADEGQTVVHAHLEVNHPETKQHRSSKLIVFMKRWDVTLRSTTGMFGVI